MVLLNKFFEKALIEIAWWYSQQLWLLLAPVIGGFVISMWAAAYSYPMPAVVLFFLLSSMAGLYVMKTILTWPKREPSSEPPSSHLPPLNIDFSQNYFETEESMDHTSGLACGRIKTYWIDVCNTSSKDISNVAAEIKRIVTINDNGEEKLPKLSTPYTGRHRLQFRSNKAYQMDLPSNRREPVPVVSASSTFLDNFRIEGSDRCDIRVFDAYNMHVFEIEVTATNHPPLCREFLVHLDTDGNLQMTPKG